MNAVRLIIARRAARQHAAESAVRSHVPVLDDVVCNGRSRTPKSLFMYKKGFEERFAGLRKYRASRKEGGRGR